MDADDAVEDRESMLARHRKELRELESKTRFMMKQAKKQKKAEVEAEVTCSSSMRLYSASVHTAC